jgi:hypothetical protein
MQVSDANVNLTPSTGAIEMAQGSVEVWITVSLTQPWLRDVVIESKQVGHDHRRKEIVFAVCFIETYLFEIVRDLILRMDYKETTRYFPVGRRLGIRDRCKEVFKQLFEDKKLKQAMNWSEPFWSEFCRLIDMRDGLVHAAISRPYNSDLSKGANPTPTMEEFRKLSQGWALQTALNLVYAMHEAIGVELFPWLENPDLLLEH